MNTATIALMSFALSLTTLPLATPIESSTIDEARQPPFSACPAGADRSPCDEPQGAVPTEETLLDFVRPLPPDVEVREWVVGYDGGVAGSGDETSRLVYSNTLGQSVFGPSNANTRFADDIITTAVHGCSLDRYVVMVSGDMRGDGSGVGPFVVDVALYEKCPGSVDGSTLIEWTSAHVDLPDNGTYLLTVVIPSNVDIPIPSSMYLGVSFDRAGAGIGVGAPATLGFSADRLDYPGFPCSAGFGRFPDDPHASFYAQIYVRGDCPESFVGYKNTNHAGAAWSAGPLVYFADDIHLEVAECNMVAYEVTHKGNGWMRVDLHTFLDGYDPANGGLIEGSRMDCFSSGSIPRICRQQFDPPIPIPQNLWAVFKTRSREIGPILTCKTSAPGRTEGFYMVNSHGGWYADDFDWSSSCWAGFDVTIYCAGQPPAGACCDMALTDEQEESVCRDGLPQMNCAFPELWEEGAACESVCEGGLNDAGPCTRQVDCPGGDCPGPFEHPCGVSVCCKPDDSCENLTENECNAVPPIETRRIWRQGAFCGEDGWDCPFNACLQRVGDCSIARLDPGCEDPYCCQDVCEVDPWCCYVAWDRLCVEIAQECPRLPSNDECGLDTLTVTANSSSVVSTLHATQSVSDPGFSCHRVTPGATGFHTVWFRFEAADTSAWIQTCNSDLTTDDSILAVYSVGDPSTPDSACGSLEEIACSDDAPACGAGTSSAFCLTDLVPGETYYIQLASRDEDGGGVHQLDIESPCPVDKRVACPPSDLLFTLPPDGVVDARRPYPPDEGALEGIQSFLVATEEDVSDPACWSVCETNIDGWPFNFFQPNDVDTVTDLGDRVYAINLRVPLRPGAVTAVTYTDEYGVTHTGRFTAHPGNVDGDNQSGPGDILFLIDVLNGVRTAPGGSFSTDCDHSGETGPPDILCLIDLLNGTIDHEWGRSTLPDADAECRHPCHGSMPCREGQFCKVSQGCGHLDNVDAECTRIPKVCPDEYDFVCGCDGVTYSNECFADAVGVSIDYRGPCEP